MFDFLENAAMNAPEPSPQRPVQSSAGGNIFVVSIGGSLIVDETGPNPEKIRQIADCISSLHSQGRQFVLVVGGGRIARSYVEAMRVFGANNFVQDLAGINVTRVNALLLAHAIPSAHKTVLDDFSMAKDIIDAGKIPVFGGHIPFFTTDSVGALIAEALGGTFVNLTNVDGIYDSNPSVNSEARRFDEISYPRLVELIMSSGSTPGQNVVLDLACCLILQRSKIPAAVLSGNDLQNFGNYINGYTFVGTVLREAFCGEDSESYATAGDATGETEITKPKKRRKSARRKPSPTKGSGEYIPPNPYQIDF